VTQISDHFKSSEFACKCGCGEYKVNEELIDLLEDIRAAVGHPVIITSGRRCEAHNRACGGKEHSQHLLGNAADIHVDGLTPKALATIIERRFSPKGMGIYATFVHVDVRSGARARW
jgi:uncharacterized protein YcbK (DUF882 family)